MHVKQLQVVIAQLDLFAEDMGKELPDVRKFALDGCGRDWLVTIQKTVYLPAIIRVAGDGTETVVLWDFGDIILAEILPQRFDIPRHVFFLKPACTGRDTA